MKKALLAIFARPILLLCALVFLFPVALASINNDAINVYQAYDEGSGTMANDSSTNSSYINATLEGSSGWTEAKLGDYAVYSVNNDGDYIDTKWIQTQNEGCYFFWMNTTQTSEGFSGCFTDPCMEIRFNNDDNGCGGGGASTGQYMFAFNPIGAGLVRACNATALTWNDGLWHHWTVCFDTVAGWATVWIDGDNTSSSSPSNTAATFGTSTVTIRLGDYSAGGGLNFDADWDEFGYTTQKLSAADILELYNSGSGKNPFGGGGDESPPNILNITCTSCNPPSGDKTEPYTTSDTTPTFNFTTDETAWCRISSEDLNYTEMNSSRDCTWGEGTASHRCTLTVQDELIYANDTVHIACKDPSDNQNKTGGLEMEITHLGINTSTAIEYGIQESSIWPGATIYPDQQVYLRKADNTQKLGTVDKVAAYGSQRWLLNYFLENESAIGLFNITPAVYVLELTNTTLTDIRGLVSSLINSTKT